MLRSKVVKYDLNPERHIRYCGVSDKHFEHPFHLIKCPDADEEERNFWVDKLI